MNKKLFSTLFLICIVALHSFGQEISFVVKAPETVRIGQLFQLSFTINTEGSNFKAPQKIDGFEILSGPTLSSRHSTSFIQGKSVTDVSFAYIYILRAQRKGSFTIPKASIQVKENTITSNTLKINVVADNQDQKKQEEEDYLSEEKDAESSSENIKENDAFIQTQVSQTQVRENEAFSVTYKLYTKLKVGGVERVLYPDYDGFEVDELNVPDNQFQTETYKGEKYFTAIVRRILLTPQRKGQLEIPSAKIGLIFQIPTGIKTFFGEKMRMEKKYFTTASEKIQVNGLPNPKPKNYSNVAGNFSISSSISTTRAKVDNPVLIRIVISGKGNTNRIPLFEIQLPNEFESNRPQISENVDVTNDGLYGTKTIEYLFVPRKSGEYTIPSVSVSYFDIETKTYKTLSTPEYNLKVGKDINSNSNEVFV